MFIVYSERMNRFDNLSIDVLYVIKKDMFENCEDFCEIEDQFRYICFQIFKQDPDNYNGDYVSEFKLDYIGMDGEYYFD